MHTINQWIVSAFLFQLFWTHKKVAFVSGRPGTQDIQAVLHQRSISIQHEHMCEVLGAYQVLIEHPGQNCHLGLVGKTRICRTNHNK